MGKGMGKGGDCKSTFVTVMRIIGVVGGVLMVIAGQSQQSPLPHTHNTTGCGARAHGHMHEAIYTQVVAALAAS